MAAKHQNDKLLTLAEAAKYLGKLAHRKAPHIDSIRRWVVRGVRGEKLPHVRWGDQIMLKVSDIDRWLDRKNHVETQPATARQSPTDSPRPGHFRAMANLAAAGLVTAPEGGAR